MRRNTFLLSLLILLTIAGLATAVMPTHAATVWAVNLDAQSLSNTDANPASTNTVAKTFNVGAIVNASGTTGVCGTTCLQGVFGWQFSIVYDNTTVVPQGDPVALAANDPASGTVSFGAQLGPTNPNWAGKIGAQAAFGSAVILPVDSTHQKIQVFYTILAPNTAVNIFPTLSATVKGNLLANVAFELLRGPVSSLTFSITDVSFVDAAALQLPNIVGGSPVTVTVTNSPPVASFTATHLPNGDPSCTPVTGLPCSAFAVSFDGSASTSTAPNTIANPGGYFWDFGDSTQDNVNSVAACALPNCNQGPVAIHDYETSGIFNATLRVVDTPAGATGSTRDSLGGVIVNKQPSHKFLTVTFALPPHPTTTSVSCSPSPVDLNVATTCTTTVTDTSSTGATAPSGTVSFSSSGTGTFNGSPCALSNPTVNSATCQVTYTPTVTGTGTHTITGSYVADSTHATSSGTFDLAVTTPIHSTSTSVSCDSSVVVNQASTCTATVRDTSASPSTPGGTVAFTPTGSATGSFGTSSPCNLTPGATAGTATCTASFLPSAAGAASVSAAYTSSDTAAHTSSSSTVSASVTVTLRSTSTTVNCASPVVVNEISTCTATVTDTSTAGTKVTPAGTVTFTPSGAPGSFTSNTCNLVPGATGTATCSASFTPSASGSTSISASYAVAATDTAHSSSSTTTSASITIDLRTTSTTVTCATPVIVNTPSSCTATVLDTSTGSAAITPVGSVSFSFTGATGAFDHTSCILVPGITGASCSVNFTPSASGTSMISESFTPTDTTVHSGSSTVTAFNITVNPPAVHSTTTAVVCNSAVVVNEAITCTATVTDISSTPTTPAGTVTFSAEGSVTGHIGLFGPCDLVPGTTAGKATCTASFPPASAQTVSVSAAFVPSATDTTHSGSSSTVSAAIIVSLRTTSTTVTCDTPVTVGTPSSCTVTVMDTSSAGTAVTPIGTVFFIASGSATGGFSPQGYCNPLPGVLGAASCGVDFTATASGSADISASYGVSAFDTAHSESSTVTAFTITVNPPAAHSTTTAVLCDAAVVVNQASTCTATVTDTNASPSTPAGTVAFTPTGSATGSFGTSSPCNLTPGATAGTATCTASFLPSAAGTASIAAAYTPSATDTTHSASSSTVSSTITVSLRTTSTLVSCSPNPVDVSVAASCSVTVTDTSVGTANAPTGMVAFSSDGAGTFTGSPCTLGSPTANSASCSVTYFSTSVGTGTHTITGNYGGDTVHDVSSGSQALAVVVRNTTTNVSCQPASAAVNSPSTCTATVVDPVSQNDGPVVGPVAILGTVSFLSDGTGTFTGSPCTLATSPALGPAAAACDVTYTPTAIGTGSHKITANYGGDGNHSSSSGQTTITVTTLNPTTTTVSCDTPVVVNQASTCTATVTDTSASGATSPSGTVNFSPGSQLTLLYGQFDSDTCNLAASTTDTASCSVHLTGLRYDLGPMTVLASYGGDSNHSSSTNAVFVISISGRAAITTLTCDTPVSPPGSSMCTVTVTDTETAGTPLTPSGDVQPLTTNSTGTFSNSGFCGLTGSGASSSCTFSYTPAVAGSHNVTAYHLSDGQHLPSSAFFVITVNPSALHSTSTSLICDTPVVANQASTCIATVTDTSSTGATSPLGTVGFFDVYAQGLLGSFDSNTCVLVAGSTGMASCSVHFTTLYLSPTYPAIILADYVGDSTHGISSSSLFTITVNPRSTSTTITCQTPVVSSSSCTVTVTDTDVGTPLPDTNLVVFSTNSTGTFSSSGQCSLSGSGAVTSCIIIYTPGVSGGHRITASPGGDNIHVLISGFFDITVTPAANQPPTVSFTEDRTTATTGQTVSLTITATDSDGTVTSITVVWGDGTVDNLSGSATTDSHAYSVFALFTVYVNATDNSGSTTQSSTAIKTIAHGNTPPNASFTESQSSALTGVSISFDASASSDPDGGTIVSYAWTFGDGSVASGVTASHFYGTASPTGGYTVTLTVTDNDGGASASITATKTVQDRPPMALFSESLTTTTTETSISFNASESSDPDGTILTYAWDFGDGTTGTGVATTHTYNTASPANGYTVTLTLTDNSGSTASATSTKIIQAVEIPPTVSFTEDRTTATVLQSVTLTISASDPDGTVTNISVVWGDGTVDNLAGSATSDTHAYTSSGLFTVYVNATDNANLATRSSASTKAITVAAPTFALTFQAFNPDDFVGGVGQLDVRLNDNLVVNIPAGLFHLTGSGEYKPFDNTWVSLGPFDISPFMLQGTNTLVFSNPLTSHETFIKNVKVVSGDSTLLDFRRTREVEFGESLTLKFSNPPLVLASLTVSPEPVFVTEPRTYTATYSGGVGPFKCLFDFGNGSGATATSNGQSCSVVFTYWIGGASNDWNTSGTFTVAVKVTGANPPDVAIATRQVDVLNQPRFTGTGLTWTHSLTTPLQTFNAQISDTSSINLLVRVDFVFQTPGGGTGTFTSPSFALATGQTRNDISFTFSSAKTGEYCFAATLNYGVDINNDGILQDSEVLGTKAPVYGCFTAP